MDTYSCPHCDERMGRWLEETSRDTYVNYYRCDACGHVWNVSKDDPYAQPVDVTVHPRNPGHSAPTLSSVNPSSTMSTRGR